MIIDNKESGESPEFITVSGVLLLAAIGIFIQAGLILFITILLEYQSRRITALQNSIPFISAQFHAPRETRK